jgi:transcriptional regulator with XRE-family HTH domain
VSAFGDALRQLRAAHGLATQQALVDRLGGELHRTTVVRLENGQLPPSPRVWRLLSAAFPADRPWLEPIYETARQERERASAERAGRQSRRSRRPGDSSATAEQGFVLGGPYLVERYDLVYVFRESRAPEEMLEVRQVRALKGGARRYVLKVDHLGSTSFTIETEALWGGTLVTDERLTPGSKTVYLRSLDFGRELRRGEQHSFAIRHWVERDPEPNTAVMVEQTIVAEVVAVHLNFWGSEVPRLVWRYGPLPDEALAPGSPTRSAQLLLNQHGSISARFVRPEIGTFFGLAWQWAQDQA